MDAGNPSDSGSSQKLQLTINSSTKRQQKVTSKEQILVGAEGSPAAEMVLVGEAPAREEVEKKRPFVGSAGRFLDILLPLAELYRGELYLTNICKHRVPGDKMVRLPFQELLRCREELIKEINNLDGPKVIVPLGKYALETITNKTGITNFRGSPLRPRKEIKHDCIVVPTFHPSIMHYGEKYEEWPLIVADLTKAKEIRDNFEDFKFPTFSFITNPTLIEIDETLDMLEDYEDMVVIDVETPHNLLSCIGLAWSRRDAISIPFFDGYGKDLWSFAEELHIWTRLRKILPKLNLAGQNVMFDWEIMHNHKIDLKPATWDSMLMHGCLYSELKHNLENIISIYTYLEYYKRDEDSETKRSALRAGREQDHWNYNCMDCVGTFWAIEEMQKELEEEDMMHVYIDFFADLIAPFHEMNMTGISVDAKRLPEVRREMEIASSEKQVKINEAVGFDLNVRSPKQVQHALFDILKMTPYREKTGKINTGKKNLEKLAYKYQSEIPTMVMEMRQEKSFLSIFSDKNLEDGRFKCNYSLSVTKTGRLASRKSYSGKGRNLQNVKRGSTRSLFVADDGHSLLGGDQKQAEARIVAYYSKDENYIRVAESGELHLNVGRDLYNDPSFSTDDPRYDEVVKHLTHGINYGMGPWGFAREANIPLALAKEHQSKFHDIYPGIKSTYYKYVAECIGKDRTLYNIFGRREIFFGQIGEDLIRSAYAFIPQSSITDITKVAIKRIYKRYRILLELHDGIIIQYPTDELDEAIQAMHDAYDVTFKIYGIERKIPIDIKIGPNWNEMEKIIE